MKNLTASFIFFFFPFLGFSQLQSNSINVLNTLLFNYQINPKMLEYYSYSGINEFNLANSPKYYRKFITKLRFANNNKDFTDYIDKKFSTVNIQSISEVKNLLLEDLKSHNKFNQDTLKDVSDYLDKFSDFEKIKTSYMYKALKGDRSSFSGGNEDELPSYLYICIYLDRISRFNIEPQHLFLVLDLLNKFQLNYWGDEIVIYFKNNNQNSSFNYIFYKPILEIIYNHWMVEKGFNLTGKNYDFLVKKLLEGYIGEEKNKIDFNALFITNLFVGNKIRDDNPNFSSIIKWMSENYEDVIEGSSKFLKPIGISFNQDGVGVISNFTLLNILKKNSINSIKLKDNRIEIEAYKKELISNLFTYKVKFELKTTLSNNCIDGNKFNFSFDFDPAFLFSQWKESKEDNKRFWGFNKTYSFTEINGEISVKNQVTDEPGSKNNEQSEREKRANKNYLADWYTYYLFGQSKNKNRELFKHSMYEIADMLQKSNLDKLKSVNNTFLNYFSTDSVGKIKLLNHLVAIAQANYDSVYFSKQVDESSIFSQFLVQAQIEAKKSKDSLQFYAKQYFSEIIKPYLLTKPLEVIKKEWVTFFDNQIKSYAKSTNQSNTYNGITRYSSGGGEYYSGTSTFTLKSQNLAYYSSNVYVEGAPIIVNLNGKISRDSNGNYKFICSQGVFNLLIDVDRCGTKFLELTGNGNNSNINSKFTFQ